MKNVVVYSTPSCKWCVAVKKYLVSVDQPFTEVDLIVDTVARERLLSAGVKTVPVVDVDGELMVGFDLGYLRKLLS